MISKELKQKAKVLLYDIETTAYQGYFFGLYDQKISPEFIAKEKSIISIAYKWYGDEGSQVISTADNLQRLKKNPHDDYEVLEKFSKILEEANYIVGHYSDKFDNKFVQARGLINGLPPFKIPTQIDTHKLAKKHFLFASNKLDYIGKVLGLGRKNKMEAGDWVGCMQGKVKAIRKMAEYNKQDVEVLEQVFDKLLPYVESKLNLHHFAAESVEGCVACGSHHVHKRGFRYLAKGVYRDLSCSECGHRWKGDKVDPVSID